MSIYPQSAVDKRLMDAAGKYMTPTQMSEYVNGQLTPAQCVSRVREILGKRITLTDFEEKRLLMYQMVEHLEWLKKHRMNDKAWAQINRAFKLISDQIERTNITADDITTKLSEAHARYFVDSISIAVERGVRHALEAHAAAIEAEEVIEVDAEVMVEAVEAAVGAGQEYLEKVTNRE